MGGQRFRFGQFGDCQLARVGIGGAAAAQLLVAFIEVLGELFDPNAALSTPSVVEAYDFSES